MGDSQRRLHIVIGPNFFPVVESLRVEDNTVGYHRHARTWRLEAVSAKKRPHSIVITITITILAETRNSFSVSFRQPPLCLYFCKMSMVRVLVLFKVKVIILSEYSNNVLRYDVVKRIEDLCSVIMYYILFSMNSSS